MDFAVIDTDLTCRLIKCKKAHLLRKLFGTVYMPTKVKEELLQVNYGAEWVQNLPGWVKEKNAKSIPPGLQRLLERGSIGPGEAQAISLAFELTKSGDARGLVLTDDKVARNFINAEPMKQWVFAPNSWSVICQAAERGLVNLEKERGDLELRCNPGRKQREKLDLFQGWLKELSQQQQSQSQNQSQNSSQSQSQGHSH